MITFWVICHKANRLCFKKVLVKKVFKISLSITWLVVSHVCPIWKLRYVISNIYLWRKVVCLFCLFCLFVTLKFPKPLCLLPHSWYHWKNLWRTQVHQDGSIMFLTYGGKIVEYWTIFHEISSKSKVKIIGEFGCTLDIVRKPSMSMI
jgi:hypothetical protein